MTDEEFIAARTNHRDDEWGGSYAGRMRFAVEIVRRGGRHFTYFRRSFLSAAE